MMSWYVAACDEASVLHGMDCVVPLQVGREACIGFSL